MNQAADAGCSDPATSAANRSGGCGTSPNLKGGTECEPSQTRSNRQLHNKQLAAFEGGFCEPLGRKCDECVRSM